MANGDDLSDESSNPWISSSGDIAHPSSPSGGGGPGSFANYGPLQANGSWTAALPHPKSPSSRSLTASQIKSALPSGGNSTTRTLLTIKGVVAAGGPLNDATAKLVNEAAKTQTNKRYIAYEAVVFVGGSIAWRANNPGNLRYAATQIATAPGAVGKFAVFATIADGRAAQKSLYLTTYGDMTVTDAINKLTPPSENDTTAYLNKLKSAGVDLDKTVKAQIDKLMSAVQANEGLIAGAEVNRVA